MSETVKFEEDRVFPQMKKSHHLESDAPEISGLQILSRYGETSTVDIWSALQMSLERVVTVWVMKQHISHGEAQAEHFESVARAVSRIRHPNLLQVIDVARTAEGIPYVVYENVDGVSLASILHLERKIDPVRALRIVVEIAKVLDSAWKQCGFVHRNIKPETVLIGSGDTVKLTNFSSATLVKPGENPLAYDDGMVVGTPNYASPEQVECLRSLDYHSDMYSAGALLYQMVTGVTPFGDETDPMRVLELQRVGTLTNPRELDQTIKPGVVHIIRKMMAKSPEDRYKWWQDVIEDLQRVLEGRPPYLESTNYVPPLSTVAPSTGELDAGTPSIRTKRSLTKVPVRKLKTYATQDGDSPTAKRKPYAPSFLTKLVVALLVGGFVFWLTSVRIRDLEGDAGQAFSDVSTAVSLAPEIRVPTSVDTTEPVETETRDYRSDVEEDSGDSDQSAIAAQLAPLESSLNTSSLNTSSLNTQEQPSNTVVTTDIRANEESELPAIAPQQQLISDIYEAVVEKKFEDARVFARNRFQESKGVEGVNLEECKQIWSAFVDASSFEDLIGVSMTRSPGTRTLSVGGKKLVFAPRMYSNGELIGTLFNADETTVQSYRIKLTEMTPEEMYDAVLSAVVDPSRPALLSRAFLTMKVGTWGAFSILVDKYDIKELKPFLDHVGK